MGLCAHFIDLFFHPKFVPLIEKSLKKLPTVWKEKKNSDIVILVIDEPRSWKKKGFYHGTE